MQFTIADDGLGFAHVDLPDIAAAPAHLVHGDQRGLVLVRMFMDEARFNEQGNEVTMAKRGADTPTTS